jgi:hypothetical protein
MLVPFWEERGRRVAVLAASRIDGFPVLMTL